MLELRPNCEHCKRPLPPESTEAMICSYECTFCRDCVEEVMFNVCPNCGGGFSQRPVRPGNNLRNDNYLGADPASDRLVFKPVDTAEHERFAAAIRDIPPQQR